MRKSSVKNAWEQNRNVLKFLDKMMYQLDFNKVSWIKRRAKKIPLTFQTVRAISRLKLFQFRDFGLHI